MHTFVDWMNTVAGRTVRVLLGVVLIWVGLGPVGGGVGVVIALIGVVPLIMGLWGRCLVEFALPRA